MTLYTHFWKVQHVAGHEPHRNWRESNAIFEIVKEKKNISSLTRVHKRSILLSESHGVAKCPSGSTKAGAIHAHACFSEDGEIQAAFDEAWKQQQTGALNARDFFSGATFHHKQ
jgi:hypothetical protein